jgi:hypothetical protein
MTTTTAASTADRSVEPATAEQAPSRGIARALEGRGHVTADGELREGDSVRICHVDDCDNPTRSARATLCAKHYHRRYRHGSVHKVAHQSGVTASHGRRYRSVYRPGHPLAGSGGKVYVHRAVLYDKIGPGPADCHWCGKTLHWTSTRGDKDCLTADHLNSIGDDNSPDNLVPACPRCNTLRGQQARAAALREAGWWSAHDTIEALTAGGRAEPIAQAS